MFSNQADYESRLNKAAYWWVMLPNWLFMVVFTFAQGVFHLALLFNPNSNGLAWTWFFLIGIQFVYVITLWLPLTALTTRRLIDVGIDALSAHKYALWSGIVSFLGYGFNIISNMTSNSLVTVDSGLDWLAMGFNIIAFFLGLIIFIQTLKPSKQ